MERVSIINNSVTFNNVPDVPLTQLGVLLSGGADSVS